jgi:PAS domain S-box-containing protein
MESLQSTGTKEVIGDLRKSLAWMDLVMETLAEGVVVVDQQMYILFTNNAFAQFVGKARVFLLGKPFFEVLPLFQEDHRVDAQGIHFPLSKESVVLLNGIYTVNIGKSSRYVEIEAAYVQKLLQAVLVVRDITDKKKSEEEIYRINKELEAFSYSVSHDLRAPLRGIDGFSQALIEDYGAKLDNTAKEYLNRIRAATVHMGELIEGMLNLSRVTRTSVDLHWVDLSAIAKEIAKNLARGAPDRQVEFHITEGLKTCADPTLIRVVLENLLENSWKYTSKTPRPFIEFSAKESGHRQIFFIRDNGAGFDMNYADKLFTPFQRLHSTSEFAGTGIGLATVRRIIRRHGGDVLAEGEIGKGETFSFTIPHA